MQSYLQNVLNNFFYKGISKYRFSQSLILGVEENFNLYERQISNYFQILNVPTMVGYHLT